MSLAAMSWLLNSIQGVGFLVGCGGGAMVGLTGSMIGGGLGTGRLVSTFCRCCWVLREGVGAEFSWGIRSTTTPRSVFCEGGGMMPKVISTMISPTLIAIASARPD